MIINLHDLQDFSNCEWHSSTNRQPLADDHKTLIDASCLIAAAYNGDLLKVKYCLEVVRCDPLQSAIDGNTALNAAADGGQLEVLMYLVRFIENQSIAQPKSSATVLHIAALNGNFRMVKYLIEEVKINPLIVDNYQKTPLHNACRNGTVEVVKYLIDQAKQDDPIDKVINDKTIMGTKILHFAAASGNCKLVEHLISNLKIDPNAPGQFGATALLIAAQEGHLNVVQFLTSLSNCSISVKACNTGQTALHIASRKGHFSIVKFLVSDKQLNPNIVDFSGCTPLHLAAQGGSFIIVKFFIEDCGCYPLCVSKKRRTPLHMAAMEGNLQVIRYFVGEFSIDPLLRKISRVSPLHLAVQTGKINVVEYYLDSLGCVLNSPDRLGEKLLLKAVVHGRLLIVKQLVLRQMWTKKQTGFRQTDLLITAVQKGHLPILEYLTTDCHWECIDLFRHKHISLLSYAISSGHLNVVRFLISESFNLYHPKKKELPPLHLACYSGHKHIVEFLIDEHGADLTQTDVKGMSPLHWAVNGGYLDAVKMLVLEKSHDPHCFDLSGRAPFHLATQLGYLDIVQWFFSVLSLDPNMRTMNILGFTSLHMACFNGFEEIVRYFISLPTCDKLLRDQIKDMTCLHIAAQGGHAKIVSLLSTVDNCDLLCKTINGATPLRSAVELGNFECTVALVSALKKQGKNFNYSDKRGLSIVHSACGFQKNVAIVKYLLDENDEDFMMMTDHNGITPLFIAVRENNIEIVNYLINRNPESVHSQDSYGNTILHKAAYEGRVNIVKSLVNKHSVDPSLTNNRGTTALHLACANGSKSLVTFQSFNGLIEKRDKYGHSPLHTAALEGHLFIVKTLISHKHFDQANLFSEDINGHTPCHLAAFNGFVHIVNFIAQYCSQNMLEMVVRMEDIRSILYTANMKGLICTEAILPHRAAEKRHISALEYFFKNKSYHPNCRDSLQRTPLHYAAMVMRNTRCLQFLLDVGSSLIAEDVFHNHPLHYAVALGHIDNVRHLILKYEKLSPSRTRGVLGMNLLDIATAGRHLEIHQNLLLREHL